MIFNLEQIIDNIVNWLEKDQLYQALKKQEEKAYSNGGLNKAKKNIEKERKAND